MTNKKEMIIQFLKFGIVGLSNTFISYFTYVAFLWLFEHLVVFTRYDYLIAQFIGFVTSVVWSFYWNNKYVFVASSAKRNVLRSFVKTFISYASTGLVLSSVLSYIWVEFLFIPKLFAPIINLMITVPLNFILNRNWAFK